MLSRANERRNEYRRGRRTETVVGWPLIVMVRLDEGMRQDRRRLDRRPIKATVHRVLINLIHVSRAIHQPSSLPTHPTPVQSTTHAARSRRSVLSVYLPTGNRPAIPSQIRSLRRRARFQQVCKTEDILGSIARRQLLYAA